MTNTILQKYTKRKYFLDKIFKNLFRASALLATSFIFIIIAFILYTGVKPFITNEYTKVNFFEFLLGDSWISPKFFGAGFLIVNTLFSAFLALLFALPVGVLSALFTVRIAPKKISYILETIIEMLSSIPSVIYGVIGAGIITKFVDSLAHFFNYSTKGGLSLLSVSIVLSIMILPTITIISISAIRSVNKMIIEGSLALGASKAQTNFKVVLLSAKSGIFAGAILAMGRALGEATAVSMVAGNSLSGITLNIFDTTRTITSTMLSGIKESYGVDYDIRFSLGIVLIIVIILSNQLLNFIKRRIGNINE